MFKNVHTVYYNSTENRRSGFELYSSEPTISEQLIAQLQQKIKDQNPVIVVEMNFLDGWTDYTVVNRKNLIN